MARNFIVEATGAPNYPGMMLATIIALKELGGIAHVYDIEACIIKNEPVSKQELSYISSNGVDTKLRYYLRWARTCLSLQYGGDIESLKGKGSSGMWKLTTAGYNICTLEDAQKSHYRYEKNLALKKQNQPTT